MQKKLSKSAISRQQSPLYLRNLVILEANARGPDRTYAGHIVLLTNNHGDDIMSLNPWKNLTCLSTPVRRSMLGTKGVRSRINLARSAFSRLHPWPWSLRTKRRVFPTDVRSTLLRMRMASKCHWQRFWRPLTMTISLQFHKEGVVIEYWLWYCGVGFVLHVQCVC